MWREGSVRSRDETWSGRKWLNVRESLSLSSVRRIPLLMTKNPPVPRTEEPEPAKRDQPCEPDAPPFASRNVENESDDRLQWVLDLSPLDV